MDDIPNDQQHMNRGATSVGRFIHIGGQIAVAMAMLLAGYLTIESVTGDGLPPGCGGEAGCGAVLTSKYAHVLGLPVGALAMAGYLLLFAALWVARHSARSGWVLWAVRGVVGVSVLILVSAGWFVYLQLGVLHAICVYCMTDHAVGTVAVVLALMSVRARAAPARRDRIGRIGFAIMGLIVASLLVGMQVTSTTPIVTIGPHENSDGATGAGNDRQLNLLGGKYVLAVADEPHTGPVDAKQVAVILLDYACPHCRATHLLLQKLQAETKGNMLLVVEPASTWGACNPHIAYDHPKFAESCELAELAWAVQLSDASKFAEFDHWMYDWPQGRWEPRQAAEARAEAERLVGAGALQRALDGGEPRRLRQRNIEALESAKSDRVPVTIIPGHPPMIGVIDGAAELRQYLQMTVAHSPP